MASKERESAGSGSRGRGLQAARRLEESLGLVRRTQSHIGRRSPSAASRQHHQRARRQLEKLHATLEALQREALEDGVTSGRLDQLDDILERLDEVLRSTRSGESRTRAFKRVKKAAKHARHGLTE